MEIDRLLTIFQESLPRPIASIYLYSSTQERYLRSFARDGENLYRIENVEISTEMNTEEDESLAFFRWLSSKIPYLYIIDGNQAVEPITDEIVNIAHDNPIFS